MEAVALIGVELLNQLPTVEGWRDRPRPRPPRGCWKRAPSSAKADRLGGFRENAWRSLDVAVVSSAAIPQQRTAAVTRLEHSKLDKPAFAYNDSLSPPPKYFLSNSRTASRTSLASAADGSSSA
jgi:hypothetical protein